MQDTTAQQQFWVHYDHEYDLIKGRPGEARPSSWPITIPERKQALSTKIYKKSEDFEQYSPSNSFAPQNRFTNCFAGVLQNVWKPNLQ